MSPPLSNVGKTLLALFRDGWLGFTIISKNLFFERVNILPRCTCYLAHSALTGLGGVFSGRWKRVAHFIIGWARWEFLTTTGLVRIL